MALCDELRALGVPENVLEPVLACVDAQPRKVCWRAPNAHPPHPWVEQDVGGRDLWCPGVKGTTMY